MWEKISRTLHNLFFIAFGCLMLFLFMQEGFRQCQERELAEMTAKAVQKTRLAEQTTKQEAAAAQAKAVAKAQAEADAEKRIIAVYAELILKDQPTLTLQTARDWAQVYREEETKNNLPCGLILAVGHVESAHRPEVCSNKGAYGIMQVQVPTGKDFAKKLSLWQEPKPKKLPKKANWKQKKLAEKAFAAKQKQADKELVNKLCTPETNIQIGSKVLATYIEWEGNLPEALKKYSCDATDYCQKVAQYHETVLANLEGRS